MPLLDTAPTTTLQKVVAFIFQCALVLDIQATLFSFFIAQLGAMLRETEIDVAGYKSVKPWLIANDRCLHNVISCILWACGLATVIASVVGISGLIIGLLLYVWSQDITVIGTLHGHNNSVSGSCWHFLVCLLLLFNKGCD